MENASALVKQAVISAIAQNLGYPVADTFKDFYEDDSLADFLTAAVKTLSDFMGKTKAEEQLNTILLHYKLKHLEAYV